MDGQDRIRYPLGSRSRWLASWLLLFLPFGAIYIVMRVILPTEATFLLLIQVPTWLALLAIGLDSKLTAYREWHVPWFTDINAHLAYGSAEDDGIHFRRWRLRFVSWKGIERLEFWPERGGRIDLHLFNRWAPVLFIVGNDSETVGYISRKLEEAWPGRSTFLISLEKSEENTRRAFRVLSKLGLGRKAAFAVLGPALGTAYFLFHVHFGSTRVYWKTVAVIWGILLIWSITVRLSHRPRGEVGAKERKIIPGTTKKLHD